MRDSEVKKVFRAAGPQVVEKQFIASDAKAPDGWFDSIEAALVAYKPVQAVTAPQEVADTPALRRGRPRKE